MQLHINNCLEDFHDDALLALLKRAGERVMAVLGDEKDEAGLVLVDDEAIHELNREHRGVDSPTDVLSFALDEGEDDDLTAPGDDWPHLVGDVIISVERAEAQRVEYGHSLEREIVYLLVHGLLHLYGFDHIDDADRRLMREREEEIMAGLDLGRD